MDDNGNWLRRSKEQTLFLILLMQKALGYNDSFEEKMPWKELCSLFNIYDYDSYHSWSRVMSTNYKELSQTDSELRRGHYSRVFQLFN